MEHSDLKRLIKIEDRIKEIMDEKGLKCEDVEFDIIPPQKMLEIKAYNGPNNISNWKYGRNFERYRTIFDNVSNHLPYEVVINDDPNRAYLMNNNTFAIQCLVIAHVYGHINFFTENKWFANNRKNIMNVLASANRRFIEYERLYGIDDVEKIIDAGHALQLQSNPFDTDETEEEKKIRIYNQQKLINRPINSEFSDIIKNDKQPIFNVEAYNNKLWRKIRSTTPAEPTKDILRYIIDNSKILEDWQKDILEVVRMEGQYYWPSMKTQQMNEGWAVYIHEQIMDQLFKEGYLNDIEHGQYNYSNALVKAMHRDGMNPYLIGSEMWKDIKNRWDKGRYGKDWLECFDSDKKERWDTKEMKGDEKIREVMKSYTDWFFMQDFLTEDIIDKTDLYIYEIIKGPLTNEYIRTGHTYKEIKEIIINSFSHSNIPKIDIIDGNFKKNGSLMLEHNFDDMPLKSTYAVETMKHIHNIWGNDIFLKTKDINEKGKIVDIIVKVKK